MKKILMVFMGVLVAILGYNFFGTEKNIDSVKEKIVVEHSGGITEVVKNPENIVVFDYGILDTLNYLDVEVKGVVKSSLPSFLSRFQDEKYQNAGGLKEPDFEKIYAMQPELIIISGRQEPFYKQLSEIAPTIYLATNGEDYIANFKKNHEIIGKIFGKEEEVKVAVEKIEKKIEGIKEYITNKKYTGFVTLSNNGKISAYGEKSRFGMIHSYFGFKGLDEIKASNHGSSVTFEYVLEKDPDFLFVIDRAAVAGGDVKANKAFDNSIIHSTSAFKNNRIIFLDAEVWYNSTGGISSTEKMISEMGNLK
ncbi:MAG: siderophore ABC transporter substrate-binding protein [Fusobacteriaceae bacterium]